MKQVFSTDKLRDVGRETGEKIRSAFSEAKTDAVHFKKNIESQVRHNPFTAVGIAFASGLIMGLIRRK